MTRKEYMEKLADALSPLPEKTREAAKMFCEEMLDDRMEDGMDEESAVAAMESPEDIALRLGSEPGESIDMGNLKLPNRDDYLQFARLADEALEGVDKALRDAPEVEAQQKAPQQPEAPEAAPENAQASETGNVPPVPPVPPMPNFSQNIQGIVESALEAARQGIEMGQQAMRDAGRQSQHVSSQARGNYEQRTLRCGADALTAVRLNCLNLPIVIRGTQDNFAVLTYYTSDSDPYDARLENGTLILQSLSRGGFADFFGRGFKFLLKGAFPAVERALPAQALVDLFVHTSNGSVKAEGLAALCAVQVETTNSRIEMHSVQCVSMALKSSNGRIVLDRVSAKRALQAKTSNSRIQAEAVRGGADVTLTTSNGSIEAQDAAAAGQMEIVTSNGHITVERVSGAAVTLRTSNASIRGTLAGRQADYRISSGTSNGRNTLPNHQDGVKPLTVHTSNASIQLGFEG